MTIRALAFSKPIPEDNPVVSAAPGRRENRRRLVQLSRNSGGKKLLRDLRQVDGWVTATDGRTRSRVSRRFSPRFGRMLPAAFRRRKGGL